MLYKGHMAAGAVMAPSAALLFGIHNHLPMPQVFGVATCAFAASFATSLIPDLDSKTSRISNKLPVMPFVKLALFLYFCINILLGLKSFKNLDIVSVIYEFGIAAFCIFVLLSLGHRQIMHSLWIVTGIYILCSRFIGFDGIIRAGISIGLIMGIVSHLWGDMHTIDGCPLFYPIPLDLRVTKYKSGEKDGEVTLVIIIECFCAILAYLGISKLYSCFEYVKNVVMGIISRIKSIF